MDELSFACERRGLRVALTGGSRDGVNQPGMLLDGLEVRTYRRRSDGEKWTSVREVVARVPVDGLAADLGLDDAAVELARQTVEALS